MKRKIILLLTCLLLAAGLGVSGCSKDTQKEEELTPLDFTVVSYDDIPKELLQEIDSKKSGDFKLTYQSDGWLYIARGYGMQSSGGYSIAVKEVSLASNAVYFDSELIGPKQGEAVNKLSTYPFVVVKVEDANNNVVFR